MVRSIVCLFLLCCLTVCIAERATVPGCDETNEGNEFYVGFFRNRFGRASEQEKIDPILWITTKESTSVSFTVSTIFGPVTSDVAIPGEITYVNISIGFVVFDSTEDSMIDSQFKGIRIKAEDNRRIVVFGQNEEVASNDAYLALPLISRPAGSSYEYIAASILGDAGTAQQAKDSVILVIGTENDTEIIIEPSVLIPHAFAPQQTGGNFIGGTPVEFRTVTIQRFQTFYLQVRGGDISGTRIIANKPISFFSGHECANIPAQPCDVLIEQIPPIDTWGTEVVTIPLITRDDDLIRVFASQDSTTVSVTRTDISSGMVTSDPSFTLSRNGFREFLISDYALIQSNNPIGVFQYSRSYTADMPQNIISDPFMMWVPSCEQYRDSFAVAPAPFDPSIEGSIDGRVAYVNYTNIAVPAEYFNASMITVNDNPIDASNFSAIRRADNSIWGYGAQLPLDVGAQIIRHQDPNAALSVTIYGFSNQQSWGCTGGTGLAPVALSVVSFESDDGSGLALEIIESGGSLEVILVLSKSVGEAVTVNVVAIDMTATASEDFGPSQTYPVTFTAGSVRQSVNIPIINDTVYELEETFRLEISVPEAAVAAGVISGCDPYTPRATVTITDDDAITVMFNQTTYSVIENAGPARPVLVLSNPSSFSTEVEVFNTDGSATGGGVDYDSGPYTVTFPVGVTMVPFDVPINDDDILEGNEDFMLTIDETSLPTGVSRGDPGQATVTIVDDDPITVMFNQSMYSVNENAGPARPVLVLSGPSSTVTTVQVFNTDGSATGGGVDYDSGPYTVTFPVGVTMVAFDVPINDDNILEGNENFMLTIDETSLPTGVTRGDPGQATVTIVDDDPITVMFNQSMYSVVENAGPARPVLVLSNPSSTTTTVQVFNTDGSATGGGVDYDSGPYTVTFPVGVTMVAFDVPINDDDILEGNENFMLTIDETSLPTGVTRGDPGQATVTIVDDDPITVMFNQSMYSVNENAGPARPVLVLSSPSSTVTTVQVFNTDGSATGGGVDYTSGPYTVTFPVGVTMVAFDVPINDDNIYEGDENFMLTIDETSLPTGVTRGDPGQATVTIVDDDPITVMFNQSMYSVNENAGPAQPVLVLSNPSSTVTVVEVFNTDGSATGGGVDYDSGPYTVTFPAGVTMVAFDVPINDDNIYEGDENFMLTIDETSLPTGVTRGDPGQATVTIVDDDPITVMFSESMYSVNEGDGSVQIGLVLSNPSSTDTTVEVFDTDGTATGGGVDYTSGPYTVTIPAGSTTATFDVPINDDMILEGLEDFMLTINSSLPTGVTRGTPSEATVNIVDNEMPLVSFEQRTYNVSESAGVVQPVLILSTPSTTTTVVEVYHTDGSATGGGVDYDSGPYIVTFPAGVTRMPFDVPITDDMILEGNENFMLTINATSLPSGVMRGTPGEATVTIVDDDPITVMFTETTYTVDEDGGSAVIGVELSNPSATDTTVEVFNTDGSATGGGVDYTSGPYTVTIPAGSTTATFNVPVTDDMILEGDEEFMLTINETSLPTGVTRGDPGEATVTIVDDDPITIMFSERTYNVDEDAGPAQPVLVLSNPSSTGFTVRIREQPGTATRTDDYSPGPYTVTIPAGVTTVPFDIPIVDDNILENTEDFNIIIVPGSLPGGVTRGDPGAATVNIRDDDAITVMFTETMYGANEDDGSVTIGVELSNPSSTDTVVEVFNTDGTATGGGVDYTSGPYTVTIPAGVTTATFDIPINDDDILEDTENFTLTINSSSLPTGVTPGNPDEATVTITDDDRVTVRFQDATDTVSEDDGSVTITIIKVGNADIPVMVTVTTSDGSATAGSDYGTAGNPSPPVITPISIPAGVSSVDITVSIINDSCREEDETFNGDLTVLSNQAVDLGSPDRTVITIEDVDVSVVEFLNDPYTVTEGNGAYNVCLIISPACDRPAEVDLVTEPKDAMPGGDYTAVRTTVTFAPNQMISCVLMDNIVDDNVAEDTECFTLIIVPPGGSGLVPGANTTVTIEDDDEQIGPTRMFNDTVIGDPLYEVPMNMISNETFPVTTSLCYEIHGDAGKIFNLISDGCVQVNANYSAMDIPENGNIISQIGVFAYDTAGGCIQILVDVDDCVPVVNGVAYGSGPGYSMNGVTARRRSNRARITVPNCDGDGDHDDLVFWVVCQNISNQAMIKFQVLRGSGLRPDAHGLIGQFWNIPVTATGPISPAPNNTDMPYRVTVDPPHTESRTFIGDLYHRVWDLTIRPCLYAGNSQGGPISEVENEDPVIEGEYFNYEVSDGIFGVNFDYNRLESRPCPA